MGLFGGSSSKSYSTTTMMDQRVIAEEAEILAGAGANVVVSMPQSIAISPQAQIGGDVILQPFSPEIRETVSQVVETFAETSKEVTEVLGQKLLTTQQGVASILPEMVKYIAIAAVAIIVARKVWK